MASSAFLFDSKGTLLRVIAKRSTAYALICVSMAKTCKQCPNLSEDAIPTIPKTVIK